MNGIRGIFCDIYKGLMVIMEKSYDEINFIEMCVCVVVIAVMVVGGLAAGIILMVTAPIWIIPYLIYKGEKEKGGNV